MGVESHMWTGEGPARRLLA